MKMPENERGYALLIVLFLVVFIMTISAVFMRGAISNAKQERKVDESHLSVVAAEMGVDYYTTLFANEFLAVRKNTWNQVWTKKFEGNEKIVNDGGIGLTLEELWDAVASETAGIIEGKLTALNSVDHPSDVDFKETTFKFRVNSENYSIAAVEEIKGRYDDGRESVLGVDLRFLMPVPNIDDSGNSNGGSDIHWNWKDITPEDFFSNGLPGNKLKKGDKNYVDEDQSLVKDLAIGSSHYAGGYLTVGEKLDLKKKSELYVDDYLAVGKDLAIDDSKLYAGGYLTVGEKLDLKKKSELYVGEHLAVGKDLAIDDSKLYAGGYLTVGEKLDLKKKSELYVGEHLAVGKDLAIDDSKLYAGGYLTVGEKLDLKTASELYAGGYLTAGKDLSIDGSKLYAGGYLTVKEKLDLKTSSLYVGGYLTVTKDLDVKQSSKVCVAGDLTVTGKFDIDKNSKVYVLGTVNEKHENVNGLISVKSLEEFEDFCGVGADINEEDYTWPSPTIDVTY